MGLKLKPGAFKLVAPGTSHEERTDYDVVIVGGGPAGLAAALYAARYELDTIVVTKLVGGYMTEATIVDDYPGLPGITGNELAERFVSHVRKLGVPIVIDEVVDVKRGEDRWAVYTRIGRRYTGYAVVLAVGSRKRKLGVPGEDRLVGRGVSYCTTCDGPLFRDRDVVVVGGGNSALISALYLAKICSRVYLVHRRDSFRAFPFYVEQALKNPKITPVLNSVVTEIIGKEKVEGVKVRNREAGREEVIRADGVFIEIGLEPPREFFEKIGLETDETGHAITKPDMSTNLPGIYVAGDAAGGPCKYRFEQIITAAAEGAKAADAAFKYIMKVKAGRSL